jgi:putative aldouronate transport system substrate-binding protein
MNNKYVFPNVFMNADDTKTISNLQADISTRINTAKSDWVMNGFTDADWNQLQTDLEAYRLSDYLAIFQKYLDAYYA